tara:strand:- start:16 stop:435 length:420 start_codon:yes stop_codon:yes gene_type:complete
MANGDITKVEEFDKIEVVNSYNIQVRKATAIMEEQADGSKTELSRGYHRHVLVPFNSVYTPAVEAVEAVEAVAEETDSDGNVTTEAVEAVTAVTGVDASWSHTPTDISGEAAQVQAIANAAWTDDVKAAYKAMREAQES